MPMANLKDLSLYYETYGDRNERALILINGLGSDHREWLYQIPHFKKHFRVIIFDNRGAGLSDTPPGPYTTSQMADDAIRLLDFLKIEKAHVLGVSMGGLIAQMVAAMHPTRVDRLVLACTAVGGEESVKPKPEIMSAFASFDENDPKGSVMRLIPYLYSKKFIESGDPEIDRFVRYSISKKQNKEGYAFQIAAISTHSSYELLPSVKAKTLVITGTEDAVIPPENSQIIARRIPDARVDYVEGGPHRFFAENYREFNEKVLHFLLE